MRRSYFLSGFASCGCCGGSVQVVSSGSTTGGAFRYGCGQNAERGATVCANARRAKLDQVDAAIRAHLATEVLTPARREAALDRAIGMLQAPDPELDRARLTERLRAVERLLVNLTDTAAQGGAVPAVVEALNRADTERRALLAALKQASANPRADQTLAGTVAASAEDMSGNRVNVVAVLHQRG